MKRLMIWMIALAALVSFIYLTIAIGLYSYQRKLLYLPDQQPLSLTQTGLTGINEITLKTTDGERLQAWYLPAKPDQPTLLFFHGNGGSIAGRVDRLAFYQQQGFGALFVSYRGYGTSTGSPDQDGLINDALASHNWLVEQNIAAEKIILVGESLGAGVAAQLAIRRPVRALIMEAPFTSTVDVARATYWWLPLDFLMKDKFETIAIIDQIKVPVLIVHGEHDEITSVEQGKQLFVKANAPKTLKIIKDGTHNGIMDQGSWQLEPGFYKKLPFE